MPCAAAVAAAGVEGASDETADEADASPAALAPVVGEADTGGDDAGVAACWLEGAALAGDTGAAGAPIFVDTAVVAGAAARFADALAAAAEQLRK